MPTIDFQGFDNHPRQPSNTCGQAVVTAILHHTKRYPFAEIADPELLFDRVLEEYGPNWPWRNAATHPRIIRRAFDDAKIAYVEHSRAALGVLDAAYVIRDAIDDGKPIVVLLDMHALGDGPLFSLHWAVVVGYDVAHDGSMTIVLSSWGRTYRLSCSAFKRAFTPWFLPKRYRNYMLVIET